MSNVLFDNATTARQILGQAATKTITHTATGSNLALFVAIAINDAGQTPTAVTCDGVAMTLSQAAATTNGMASRIYHCTGAVAAGTRTVAVTAPSTNADYEITVMTFSNATAVPVSPSGSSTSFYSSPITDNVTTPAGGIAIDVISANNSALACTAAGSQISPTGARADSVPNYWSNASYLLDATAMGWTFTGGGQRQAAHSAVVVVPFSAPPVPTATIVYTEANDVSAVTGSIAISGAGGSINYTEANDVSALSGTVTALTATVTTGAFKNNTGTVLASLTGLTVTVLTAASLGFVKTFANKTTDASGVMTVTDALLTAGVQYAVVTTNASGTLGVEKYTAA